MTQPRYPPRARRLYPRPTPAQVEAARQSLGLTPTAAADWLCVPYRTWRGWEAGEYPMPAGMWRLLRLYSPARHAAVQRAIDDASAEKPRRP